MAGEADNPQQVLTEEILSDARRQAERLRRRAERDAKQSTDQARRQAEEERDRRLAEARAEADRRRRLTLATVPVEEGRLRARRVEAVLGAIRDEARERLRDRDGFDYREAVARLAAEAVARMEGETFTLGLSEADRHAFGEGLAEDVARRVGREGLAVRLADEPADIDGGVIVRDAEGRQCWDNSLAARLERLWPELRRRIAEATGLLRAVAAETGEPNGPHEQGARDDETPPSREP